MSETWRVGKVERSQIKTKLEGLMQHIRVLNFSVSMVSFWRDLYKIDCRYETGNRETM